MTAHAPTSDPRDVISASSAGGAPFLLSYGATLMACGIAAFFLPARPVALAAMFQGSIALPAALLLESKMRWTTLPADHSLKPLSIQLAMSQVLALPVVLLVYQLNPNGVPLALAAIAGCHLLPYAWLQRSRAYAALAVSVSIGALALQIGLGHSAGPVILTFLAVSYWIAAPLVWRNARALTAHLAAP